jgi:hypothetical protein
MILESQMCFIKIWNLKFDKLLIESINFAIGFFVAPKQLLISTLFKTWKMLTCSSPFWKEKVPHDKFDTQTTQKIKTTLDLKCFSNSPNSIC